MSLSSAMLLWPSSLSLIATAFRSFYFLPFRPPDDPWAL